VTLIQSTHKLTSAIVSFLSVPQFEFIHATLSIVNKDAKLDVMNSHGNY